MEPPGLDLGSSGHSRTERGHADPTKTRFPSWRESRESESLRSADYRRLIGVASRTSDPARGDFPLGPKCHSRSSYLKGDGAATCPPPGRPARPARPARPPAPDRPRARRAVVDMPLAEDFPMHFLIYVTVSLTIFNNNDEASFRKRFLRARGARARDGAIVA